MPMYKQFTKCTAANDMLSTKDGACTFDHREMHGAESNEQVLSFPISCRPPMADH